MQKKKKEFQVNKILKDKKETKWQVSKIQPRNHKPIQNVESWKDLRNDGRGWKEEDWWKTLNGSWLDL